MRQEIASLVDLRVTPGMEEAAVREEGVLLLAIKDRIALIGVRGPMSKERVVSGRFLWFVDLLQLTYGVENVELVLLEQREFEEILDLAEGQPK